MMRKIKFRSEAYRNCKIHPMNSCFIKILLLLVPSAFCYSQSAALQRNDSSPGTSRIDSTQKISFQIIEARGQTYGYDIFVNGRMIVHQTTVPCYPGMDGFRKKNDAEKIAELVICKIRKGVMPPTVTKSELETLGVRGP